jgi:hypothetical protein
MDSSTEEKYKARAIHEFLLHCTVPILADLGEKKLVVGTGTLFEAAGQHFLITAKHVFEEFEPGFERTPESLEPDWEKRGVPLTRYDTGQPNVWTIAKAVIILPKNDLYDVAVVPIDDPILIENLQKEWHFISPKNIDGIRNDMTEFMVVGYPEAMTDQDGERIVSKFYCQKTRRYSGTLDDIAFRTPYDPNVDFLLEHAKTMLLPDGRTEPMPKAQGLSGSSVWGILPNKEGVERLWNPESEMKVVAIESGAAHKVLLRTKRWHVAANMLRMTYPEAAKEVCEAVGGAGG